MAFKALRIYLYRKPDVLYDHTIRSLWLPAPFDYMHEPVGRRSELVVRGFIRFQETQRLPGALLNTLGISTA